MAKRYEAVYDGDGPHYVRFFDSYKIIDLKDLNKSFANEGLDGDDVADWMNKMLDDIETLKEENAKLKQSEQDLISSLKIKKGD